MSDHPSADVVNPQQFRLLDLFGLMTLVALASAMAAPVLRGFETEYRNHLLIVVGAQILGTLGTLVYLARKRKRLLDEAGPKMGAAFCGQFTWRHWPLVSTVVCVLIFVLVQLILAAEFAEGERSLFSFLYYSQFAFFTGRIISIYRWGAYPNSVELFQNGISQEGTKLIPWERIKVRPSPLHPGRIAIVLLAKPDSAGGTTIMAHVSDQLREQVIAAAKG